MRKLSFDEILAATTGAVHVCENEGGVRFYRFTEEEETLYRERKSDPYFSTLYPKTYATAGVKLSFRTDSRRLSLAVLASSGGSSRTYFSLDVLVNGARVGSIDNYGEAPLPDGTYWQMPFPLGEFARDFDLGEGEKLVTVHLPWSICLTLRMLSLDDGAAFIPERPAKRLLVYGDSITHGYDATRPHLRQIARICDAFGLEEYNKAIGGEVFFPALAGCACDLSPDYVLVAYGTNDWAKCDYDTFRQSSVAFFSALAARHPGTPVFAITPIVRGDLETTPTFGRLSRVGDTIREIAAAHTSITVIEGSGLVPRDPSLFSSDFLHPDDAGFAHYFENLRYALAPYLK